MLAKFLITSQTGRNCSASNGWPIPGLFRNQGREDSPWRPPFSCHRWEYTPLIIHAYLIYPRSYRRARWQDKIHNRERKPYTNCSRWYVSFLLDEFTLGWLAWIWTYQTAKSTFSVHSRTSKLRGTRSSPSFSALHLARFTPVSGRWAAAWSSEHCRCMSMLLDFGYPIIGNSLNFVFMFALYTAPTDLRRYPVVKPHIAH